MESRAKRNAAIACAAVAAVLALAAAGIAVFRRVYFGSGKEYERAWDIDLPSGMKLKFRTSESYIDGSARYSVFFCKRQPEGLFRPYAGRKVGAGALFEEKVARAVDGLKIPESQLPDFSQGYEYGYLQRSHGIRVAYLYLVYTPANRRLIVCEDISQYPY